MALIANVAIAASTSCRARSGCSMCPGGRFFVIDLRLVPHGPGGILVRCLGLSYRLLAGWTGQDVITALQETFDTVQVVRGGWSWVVIAVATN